MKRTKLTSRLLPLLMVLMLAISCMNITALARGGQNNEENQTQQSYVDHIDLGVSLTADIVVDGVLYEDLTYSLESSDLTADNLRIYSTLGTHSYSLSSITTSTGSSGISQFRVSGNFPVGTLDNPNYYTVQLSKTVTVTTSDGDFSIPVIFSASFHYWDAHNDCPGLRNSIDSWSSGSVIGGSGLDFLLGNAEADLDTKGTISIQKTIAGLELAEGDTMTYTFDIYKADGSQYDSISITIDNGSNVGLATISEVPYGTYYIVEQDASVEGYTLVTEYAVGTSSSSDRSGDIVLSEDNPDGAAHVINTYSAIPVTQDLTDISVTKVWDDNGNPDRPTDVSIQLLCDGEYYGEPVMLNSENEWTCTWIDLDAGYEWSVIELNVPEGYTVGVVADETGTVFTVNNSMDYQPPEETTEPSTEETTEPATEETTEPATEETTEPATEETTEPATEETTEPATEETTEPATEETTEPATEETTDPTETTEGGDMADVPKTGGSMLFWVVMCALSGSGLVLSLKKKEN